MNTRSIAVCIAAVCASASAGAQLLTSGHESAAARAAAGLSRAAAAAPGPKARTSQTPWQAVLAKVTTRGTYSTDYSPFPPTMGLESVRGPREATHQADYVNAWGYKDQSGRFVTGSVTMVSEDWQKQPNGDWRIDQWLFTLQADGAVHEVSHRVLREDASGRVLGIDYESLEGDAGQAKIRAKYDALLAFWTAF